MKKMKTGAVLMALFGLASFAGASLVISNGDFETYDADQSTQASITGWYSVTTNDFYRNPWQDTRDPEVPTDTQSGYAGQGALAFSGFAADNDQNGVTGVGGANSWVYQSIGSDAAATAFDVTFDYGDFGNSDSRDFGIRVAVYEFNGTGAFVAADNTDVLGGDGVTLLDSFVIDKGDSTGRNLYFGEGGTLDISAQNGGELFLRINNYDPTGSDNDWIMMDNVAISNVIPEPATLSVVALSGLSLLFIRRRFK